MSDRSETSTYERRLVAIMFTDIVGYTSMMQRDEKVAVQIIEKHRQILGNNVKRRQGEILQYYGDGSLSVFPSAIEAVECAIGVQKELTQLQIPLRIGIHLGDVKIKGEAIFGDGVNVASRLQSLGIAGSIIISDSIYHLIRNQSTIKAVLLGDYMLKNVEEAKAIYALEDAFLSVPKPEELPSKERIKPKRSKWFYLLIITLTVVTGYATIHLFIIGSDNSSFSDKSIAVLPFENLSNDPEQAYFSDGITEDIINHLAKIEELKVKSRTTTEQYKNQAKTIPVIGRELGVSYILEGSVRKADNMVRIVAQLIDVQNDVHIWTETYDREMVEIFDIQSDIAVEIAQVLEARLTSDERRHIRGRGRQKIRPTEITAYDYLLKARNIWREWNDEQDLQNALQLIEEAIKLDPGFARAYVLKGNILHFGMSDYGVPTDIWIRQAQQLADQAISIDSTLADAYLLKGNIYRILDGNEDEALKNFKKAYYLKPGQPEVLENLGYYYFSLGAYDKGAQLIIKSIERKYSVRDPEYYLRWGNIYARPLNAFEKAEELYTKAINLNPGWITPHFALSQLYRYEGNLWLAEKAASNALRISAMDQESIDLMAWINLQQGDLESAEAYWSMYQDIEKQFSDTTQYIPFRHRLGYVKYLQGDTATGKALIREQLQLDTERQQNLRGYGAWINRGFYYDLACTNAFLGHHEKALSWLDSAHERGFISLWYLENDPLLRNLKNTPEYNHIWQELLERQRKQGEAFRKAVNEINYIPPEIKIIPQQGPNF